MLLYFFNLYLFTQVVTHTFKLLTQVIIHYEYMIEVKYKRSPSQSYTLSLKLAYIILQ